MHLFKRTYIFLLSLALTVSACKKNERYQQQSYQTPIVNFGWTGEQSAPATITFSNQTILGNNFQWDFGNGVISNKTAPDAITYNQPGSYEVVLRATNGDKIASIKKTIVIVANINPVALFSYTFKDQKLTAPATVNFVNESTDADSYAWDINGTLHSTETPPPVVFNNAGDYKVKLIAIKGNKQSPVYESTIKVLPTTDPVAKFSLAYHPFPYSVGEEIQLVNLSANSDAWSWTFGTNGPAPSTDEHPIIKFAQAGTYTITLIAKKGNKESAPRSINLKIN